jgi:zinc transport system substrate-binding protein
MTATSRLFAATSLVALTAGGAAAAPAVVVDIAPVHSIVARVMDGAGEPTLLLPPGASPHGYALRPSEADALERADIVFWVGDSLTPWLVGPLENIAADARHVAFDEADGVRLLPVREGGPFEAHAHDHDHIHDREEADAGAHAHDKAHDDDHDHDHAHDHDDEHGHDHDHDHDEDHAAAEDHAHDHDHGHDHDHDHADDHAAHEDHAHDHAHGEHDGHIWLDPMNAAAIAHVAAEALAESDPDNAETYRENAEAFEEEMAALVTEIASDLAELDRTGFIVFHDAYQYFEDRFGLPAAGSIALHDADQPSPARMARIQERIGEADVACVFAEPQFDPRLIETATEGSDARRGILDPLGAELNPGPDLYPTLIRTLASDIRDCFDGD